MGDPKDTIYPLILNSSNLDANGYNNRYTFNFPVGSVHFKKGSKLALSSVSIYYSWFNISPVYNNTSFQFTFTTASGTTTYTVNLPSGNYSVSNLNSYLQQFCITNGLYLVNGSGNFAYYLEILTNPTYYSVQVNCYPFPTSLPSGWTNPGGLTFPATASTPQLIVSSTNNFGSVIGFAAGTYPSAVASTTQSFLSTLTPQVSPVESLILTCNLLNNRYNVPNTILYSFSPAGVSFGNIIQSSPNYAAWIPIQEGSYSNISVSFVDQNYGPIQINDPNLVVQLLISNPP